MPEDGLQPDPAHISGDVAAIIDRIEERMNPLATAGAPPGGLPRYFAPGGDDRDPSRPISSVLRQTIVSEIEADVAFSEAPVERAIVLKDTLTGLGPDASRSTVATILTDSAGDTTLDRGAYNVVFESEYNAFLRGGPGRRSGPSRCDAGPWRRDPQER